MNGDEPDEVHPVRLSENSGNPSVTRGRTLADVTLLVLLCGLLFFFRIGVSPLQEPDETRCAKIVREMLRTGNWLAPHLDGKLYLDKPAPFFWLAAVGYRLTGSMALGGRGVAGVSGILMVLVTYFFARRIFDRRVGFLAGIVLATTAGPLLVARWLRMDMPFAAAMWTATWCFWWSQTPSGRRDPARRRRGWCGFYAFCAFATLFKGPAGLVLPVMFVGTYLLLSGRPRRVLEFFSVPGMLLYLLIAAPWFVTVSIYEPTCLYRFLIQQNFGLYLAPLGSRHHFSPFLYLPILLVGQLPWTSLLPAVCTRYFPRRWRLRKRSPGILLLWVQVFVTLLFFALSRTRAPHYILPAFPPLAVMTAGVMVGWIRSRGDDSVLTGGPAALVATVISLLVLVVVGESWVGNADRWLVVPVAACMLGVVGIWVSLRYDNCTWCVISTIATIVVIVLFSVGYAIPSGCRLLNLR